MGRKEKGGFDFGEGSAAYICGHGASPASFCVSEPAVSVGCGTDQYWNFVHIWDRLSGRRMVWGFESGKKTPFLGTGRGDSLFFDSSPDIRDGRQKSQRGLGAASVFSAALRRLWYGRRNWGWMERVNAVFSEELLCQSLRQLPLESFSYVRKQRAKQP